MTESIRKKEKAVKASFRIEMTDEERKLRDSQVTNQYHTGNNTQQSAAAQQAPQITMSKEDQAELEADRLAAIAEDGQRESSDDGDDDDDYDDEDPDDDLNF